MRALAARWWASVVAPQPIARLAFIRVLVPIAVLAFLATRLIHADDWLSSAGFHPPAIPGGSWRQPVSFPPIEPTTAWLIAVALVVTGIATSIGFFTPVAAGAFGLLLGYTTLADRLEAFTVSKLGTVLALALALTPAGARYSVDALRRTTRPDLVSGGCVRFFQYLVPIFYCSSGICKAFGDWLRTPYVLWSHLHDSYQTSISLIAANHLPAWTWVGMQATTLVFELGAPIWFAWRRTRPYALAYGIAMHVMIGLMFGPVRWFALLMIALLVGCYAERLSHSRA